MPLNREAKLKYSIGYQYRPKGQSRPNDNGQLLPCEIDSSRTAAPFPNIGDHIHIAASQSGQSSVAGRVASRFFIYHELSDGSVTCHVNVVIDEVDDSVFATLIKE